jgi:hypothetical protein
MRSGRSTNAMCSWISDAADDHKWPQVSPAAKPPLFLEQLGVRVGLLLTLGEGALVAVPLQLDAGGEVSLLS